jgi:hypothetical protein
VREGEGEGDRLGLARRVLLTAWCLVALLCCSLAAWSLGRRALGPRDPCPALVRGLALSELSLTPSGRPPRTPAPAAVDLRHQPGLPLDELADSPGALR